MRLLKCCASNFDKAFVEVASWVPDLNVKTDNLDADPWLLNVENGTIDLRTGELREHRAEDLITKIARVKYDKTPTALSGNISSWRL
jgi:phage/plasmid-associated DNA primase